MANAIVGTFVLLARPPCSACPSVCSEACSFPNTARHASTGDSFAADVLNGVPSITWVCRLWIAGRATSARLFPLAGGVVLGMMMIPLVMRTTEEVLQLVPNGYREAASR